MNYYQLCYLVFDKNSDSLESQIRHRLRIQSNKEYFPYIPINHATLADLLKYEISKIKNIGSKSFLDVGAGNSSICTIMKIMGFNKCQGLEYEKIYVDLNPEVLIQGDILEYDFKDWDVLYSYHPIINPELMCKGLDRIVSTMKPGAVLYFVGANGSVCDHLLSLGGVRINKTRNLIKFVKPRKKR